MDERLEKAFQTANYMASLSLQRATIFEEYKQSLLFYQNGCSFTADANLINLISSLTSSGKESAVIIDNNNIPTEISNLKKFLEECLEKYTSASFQYLEKYSALKKHRKVQDLIAL